MMMMMTMTMTMTMMMMMMICVKYIKTSWKTTKHSVGNVGANEQVKKFTSKGILYDIIIISGAVIASFNA